MPDPVVERVEEQECSETQPFDGGASHSDEIDATYSLDPDGTKLLMKHHRLHDRTLYHAYGDTYATNNFRIDLERDESGAVIGFHAGTVRVGNFRFARC